jgi:hypothetical protein
MCRRDEDHKLYLQRQVIRKILEHLKIYEDKPQRAPPLEKIVVREIEMVLFDDGWPGYEEPTLEQ